SPFSRFNREVPIKSLACSTQLVCRIRVQQPRVRFEIGQARQRLGIPNLKRLHTHQPELKTIFRRFSTMKLQQVKTTFSDRTKNEIFLSVHKSSHLHNERRQIPQNDSRFLERHITRTLLIKYETQRVSSCLSRRHPVFDIRDAAYFHFDRHLSSEHSI